jgi:glycosyltransferase involved in cell wall biosynthesis
MIEQYAGNEFLSHKLPFLFGGEKLIVRCLRQWNLSRRNRALRGADCVTTVSPWHVNELRRYNPNVELIYNGYDPELFYPGQVGAPHFIITYTGRLISTAMQDPSLLLEALSVLGREQAWSPDTCRVHWYVDEASWAVIREASEKAGVLPFMQFKGQVPATQIPLVLNSSSVLLLLTNKTAEKGPKGIMTTNFFEYLAVGKPVLCVRSDESYLAAAIEEAHAGLAATATEEVCRFLNLHYTEWKEKGYTSAAIDREVLRRYSRQEQAGQFARLFNRTLQ